MSEIKHVIVTNGYGWYENKVGEIFKVINPLDYGFSEDDEVYYVDHSENKHDHTLHHVMKSNCEPIMEYHGKFYRMVKRMASVGELVKIVGCVAKHSFDIGSVTEIMESDNEDDGMSVRGDSGSGWLCDDDYVALEPVTKKTNNQNNDKQEEVLEKLANIAVRLSKLEEKPTDNFQPLTNEILAADLPTTYRLELALEYERKIFELKEALLSSKKALEIRCPFNFLSKVSN